MRTAAALNLVKSILHNIGVCLVGLAFAYGTSKIDRFVGFPKLDHWPAMVFGIILLAAGFLLRVWATYHFYQHRMKVISLETQNTLVTDGPFKFARNPLYLGGNVFIFFGAGLILGSISMLILTVAHFPLMNWMVRREESQLEATFGEEWVRYRQRVPRWL